MLITRRYLKTLEQVETAKTQKQIILDQCDELEHDLQLAINASNQRLKLFNNHNHNQKEESSYAHYSRNFTRN